MLVRWLALLLVPRYTVFPDIPRSLLVIHGAWVYEQSVVVLDSWSRTAPRALTDAVSITCCQGIIG
jgi:hypothetical protein